MPNYTWIALHREATAKLLTFRDKQTELIDLLHEMQDSGLTPVPLNDQTPRGTIVKMTEIDPFTFLATFNRGITDTNRNANWTFLKKKWGLTSAVPTEFPGIPVANNQNSWWISYAYHRKVDAVPLLWELATQAYSSPPSKLDPDLYKKCLAIRGVGLAKLTMGLFWINPEAYLSLDSLNREYLKKHDIDSTVNNFDDYLKVINAFHAKFDINITEFSRAAWLWSLEEKHYAFPFDKIFSPGEADTALDHLARCMEVIRQELPADNQSLVVILKKHSAQHYGINLNLGIWCATGVNGENGANNIWFLCPTDHEESLKQNEPNKGLKEKIDGTSYIWVEYSTEEFERRIDELWPICEKALKAACKLFRNHKKSSWAKHNRQDLIDLIMHKERRAEILKEGIPTSLPEESVPTPDPVEPITKVETYSRKEALADLFMSDDDFDNMLNLLQRKKNIILQGAPGVGKTFVARRLAYTIMKEKNKDRAPMIQFHQSYSYEDFIQGYRPDGNGGFKLNNGTFHKLCKQAQRDPGRDYFLIIDEINRGNLSKIFGELMMLMEADKRGDDYALQLTYSESPDDTFYIPENVHLIGTMNTADRSLAMVDYALRRRFAFIDLAPEFDSPKFKSTLKQNGANSGLIDKIVLRMNELNQSIFDDSRNLGRGYRIGHSFFCPSKESRPDEMWYDQVIKYEIAPLIREYWLDDDSRVNTEIDKLQA